MSDKERMKKFIDTVLEIIKLPKEEIEFRGGTDFEKYFIVEVDEVRYNIYLHTPSYKGGVTIETVPTSVSNRFIDALGLYDTETFNYKHTDCRPVFSTNLLYLFSEEQYFQQSLLSDLFIDYEYYEKILLIKNTLIQELS